MSRIEEFTAIQGVCAWPNLQRLADGTLVAFIWNQPCHGLWEGDLDCWASEDDGGTWRLRSRVAQHEPGTARMNCAAGFARNGDLIVLCSGWDKCPPVGSPHKGTRHIMRPWICRSPDGCRTWDVTDDFPDPPAGRKVMGTAIVPFGNLAAAADGSLCVAAYLKQGTERECYLLRSRDDGRTWGEPAVLNPQGNETTILHLGGGRWLASSRNNQHEMSGIVELCTSEDDGHTWQRSKPLTMPGQVTSHLMRVQDGRVLLSYGNRNWGNFGVDVRFSEDEGGSWGPPIRIASTPQQDCGYPSSVQLPDGRLVTAYYTSISRDYHYEMRVARWNPDDFLTEGKPVNGW